MEYKLTITGTFADIQQALSLLQGGNPVETEVKTYTPENYRHDPPADFTLKAIDLKREETMANGATLNPDLPVEPMERIEKPAEKPPKRAYQKRKGAQAKPAPAKFAVPPVSERLCHTCGKTFRPSRPTSHHCSKYCYMVEWREKNKPAKGRDEIAQATDDLDRKLSEIRKTHPAPSPRPYSQKVIAI